MGSQLPVAAQLPFPHSSISSFTTADIAKDAGLTPEPCRELMWIAVSADFQLDVFLGHSPKDRAAVCGFPSPPRSGTGPGCGVEGCGCERAG